VCVEGVVGSKNAGIAWPARAAAVRPASPIDLEAHRAAGLSAPDASGGPTCTVDSVCRV
jgi:hypothetical protein